MALSAQRRAMAGSEGRGEHSVFVPAPSRGRTGSLPPASSRVPAPGPARPGLPRDFLPSCSHTAASLLRRAGLEKPKGVY